MRTAALVLMILLMFIALCLILVAINTEQWVIVTVGETTSTDNGLTFMDRTQGIIKECWRSMEAEQYIQVNENQFFQEAKCLHIGIGVQNLDMRAGLLTGTIVSLAIQALLVLICLLYAFIIIVGRPLYSSDTQEFKKYMTAALCVAFFASLLGVLGMVFFHTSILVQSDAMANLISLYPNQFTRDQSQSLKAATEIEYGYSMWCGWMACGVCFLAWIIYAFILCCRKPNYAESDTKTLRYTPTTHKSGTMTMIEESPKIHTIQGPPIYDCRDNLGNHFIYDPLRAKQGHESPRMMHPPSPAGLMYSQPPALAYNNFGYSPTSCM